jgi:hypothetical protein
MFLRNIGIYFQVHMTLQPSKPTSTGGTYSYHCAFKNYKVYQLSAACRYVCIAESVSPKIPGQQEIDNSIHHTL